MGPTNVATLYSNTHHCDFKSGSTVECGTSGGHAAAFAYDLATSVVYTRQGNPAWAAQERDGFFAHSSDDKFFGDATGDSRPDWSTLTI